MRARRKASWTSRPHGRRKRQGGSSTARPNVRAYAVTSASSRGRSALSLNGNSMVIASASNCSATHGCTSLTRVVRSVDGIAARRLEHWRASQQVLVERAAQGLQAWRPGGLPSAPTETWGRTSSPWKSTSRSVSERLHATAHGGRLGRIRILAVPAAVEVGARAFVRRLPRRTPSGLALTTTCTAEPPFSQAGRSAPQSPARGPRDNNRPAIRRDAGEP